MGFSLDPYMYQDDDGRIYIVQNVVGGGISKSIAVSDIWYNYHINIGSDPVASETVLSHMIYGISPASTLIPIEDNTSGDEVFHKLIYYGSQSDKAAGIESRYGALLEIL
jgi:hypothetical protein